MTELLNFKLDNPSAFSHRAFGTEKVRINNSASQQKLVHPTHRSSLLSPGAENRNRMNFTMTKKFTDGGFNR